MIMGMTSFTLRLEEKQLRDREKIRKIVPCSYKIGNISALIAKVRQRMVGDTKRCEC